MAVLGAVGFGQEFADGVIAGLERATIGHAPACSAKTWARWTRISWRGCAGRSIGVVLQAFHLLPTMTALQNVMVPMELAGAADPRGRASAELAAVGLGRRLEPLSDAAFGRRAAARRHRPRHRACARAAAGRRADRQSRRRHRREDHRPAVRPRRGGGGGPARHHPRSRRGRARRPRAAHRRRAARRSAEAERGTEARPARPGAGDSAGCGCCSPA